MSTREHAQQFSAKRLIGYSFGLLFTAEVLLLLSPVQVLYRSSVQEYVLDDDILLIVPDNVPRGYKGLKARKMRLCAYWAGSRRQYIDIHV